MDLRKEIVETEKVRSDLFKWKIVLVAALGSAALGFGKEVDNAGGALGHPEYLLCLIPIVCLYVDVLCSHLNLRIMVIGHYLQFVYRRQSMTGDKEPTMTEPEYESFVHKARTQLPQKNQSEARQFAKGLDVFTFEDFALHFSTLVLSFFVPLLGLLWFRYNSWQEAIFFIAGIIGMLTSAYARKEYRGRCLGLDFLVNNELEAYKTSSKS